MWQKLAKTFFDAFNSYIKPWLVSAFLSSVGLAGGFWTWLVGLFVSRGAKLAEKEIESQARIADQTKTDKQIREKYMDQIKNGASEDELIKSETDILNSGRH